MYTLIIFYPIISIILSAFFSNLFINKKYLMLLNISSILTSLIISIYLYYKIVIMGAAGFSIYLFNWFHIGLLNVNFTLTFDFLSVSMILIIFFISFCIHLFSIDYMFNDVLFIRFINYIGLFTIFMSITVLSTNLIQLFVGWEGIGLMSYLLINFWHARPEANRSALKAIIFNKFGDAGFYLFIIFSFTFYKTVDITIINSLISFDTSYIYVKFLGMYILKSDIITLFILLAAIGKSAQLGLHSWLPDAMEGPTPVSALLHSATMVTAGVFLLIRCSNIIEYSFYLFKAVVIIALITSIFASFSAIGQFDIKKSIAYSTTGQLAYMFAGCGFSQYYLAFQHLFDHAFFKAALFVGAGSIIYVTGGLQDIRLLGGLYSRIPLIYLSFLLSTLSLLGLPFTSGFYSKESIIESILLANNTDNFIFMLSTLSISLSTYYSINLIYSIFHKKSTVILINEILPHTKIALVLLTVCGILSGFFSNNIFNNSINFADDVISISIDNNTDLLEPFDDITWYIIADLPLFFTVLGIFLSVFINNTITKNRSFILSVRILNRKFYYDSLVWIILVFLILHGSYNNLLKFLDRGVLESVFFQFFSRNFNIIMIYFKNQSSASYLFNFIFFIFFSSFTVIVVCLLLIIFLSLSSFVYNLCSFFIFSILLYVAAKLY